MSAPRRGVLGGTFDPVHEGHLALARRVAEAFGLDEVLFVPCAQPPHKRPDRLTPAAHRLEMLRLALDGCSGLRLCTIELDRGGVSYTIDTLRALRDDGGAPPLFIMGMDSLVDIDSWREPRALLDEFDLVVVDRPGSPPSKLPGWVAERLGGTTAAWDTPAGGRLLRLEISPIRVSASDIRRRARRGETLEGLVPSEVARYIRREQLYRHGGATLTPELQLAVEAAQDKKALDLVVLDLRGLSDVTDYFLICHGTSDRQVLAIADAIDEKLRAAGTRCGHTEGHRRAEWILMDYFDMVVHVFLEDKREFYRLERLWGDAPRVALPVATPGREATDAPNPPPPPAP